MLCCRRERALVLLHFRSAVQPEFADTRFLKHKKKMKKKQQQINKLDLY